MSQYPQQPPSYPMMPPPPAYDPYRQPPGGDGRAAAKRASTMMFVLGGLITMFGACGLAQSFTISTSEFQAMMEQQQKMMPAGQQMPFSVETARTVGAVMQGLILFAGVLLVACGAGVRRGGRGVIVAGIVVSSLIALLMGVMVLMSLLAALLMPLYIGVACVFAIPTALFGLQIFWLAQAAKAASTKPQNEAAMRQYQAQLQMWYYQQQQQQAYMQGQYPPPPPPGGPGYYAPPPPQQPQGYGYGQQPAPSPQQSPQSSPQPQWKDPNAPPEG